MPMCFKDFFAKLFGKSEQPLGVVNHYFDQIQVAVINLNGALEVGDKIKIVRAGENFTETVNSMQINHQPVQSAQKGQEIAVKISRTTKAGAKVFKL